MIRLLAEAAFAMSGIGRILLFRPDWREKFNLTERGLIRSFGAALIALPAYVLMHAFFSQISPPGTPVQPLWYFAIDLARLWLLFPIVATLAVIATGMKKDFAAWLTVRNWSVLAQILIVTLIAATHVAGLTGQVFLAYFFVLFYPVFLTVLHLSIAFAVLRGPWQRVAGAGMIVVLTDFVSREGMQALATTLNPVQPS